MKEQIGYRGSLILTLFIYTLLFESKGFPLKVDVSDSPTSNLALTLQAIQSAEKSLFMNAYELNSPEIVDALCSQIRKGTRTEILLEGEPVGGFSEKAEQARNKIVQAMETSSHLAPHKFYFMTSQDRTRKRRFRYDHAKYIIVDEAKLLIGSENYSRTGNPLPSGAKGNRGWQTFVHDEILSNQILSIFNSDKDTSKGDVIQLVQPSILVSEWLVPTRISNLNFNTDTFINSITNWSVDNHPIAMEAEHVEHLTSPTTSMNGLLAFIDTAQKTLDLELMSFNSMWGNTGKNSPLIKALEKAARRGVKIRVLLNDESVFAGGSTRSSGGSKTNLKTINALNELAKDEQLNIEAVTADVRAMKVTYIHNKGVLSDGFKTLVSSINWNQNSVENNRETAISITSQEINQHYLTLFEKDWEASSH